MASVGYTLAGVRYDEGMRLVPGFFFAGLVGMIALACGGASDQDVLSASSSTSSSGSSSSGAAASSSSGATSTSGGTTSSGSSSGGTTTTDAGKPPPTGTCEPEAEPNNEPGDANELKTSLCGSLLPVTELDFVTWKLESNTKTMDFTYQGNVKIRIFVEGHDPVELSPTSNPAIPFVVGKPYLARISAAATAAKIDWRVNLVTTN
jgi:hypothetical protein